MNKENANGLEENKTNEVNQTSTENLNNQGISSVIPESNINPVPVPVENNSIEPVKPTLDSILNGDESTLTREIPNKVPTVDTLESNTLNPTTIVEAPKIESLDNEIASPTIENIPNDAVVDRSAETLVNPVVEETKIKPETLVANEIPTIEKVEDFQPMNQVENTIPVDNTVVKTIPETLEEVSKEPNEEQTLPPVDDFNEVPAPPTTEETGKNRKKDNKKKTWILLLIFILIVAIGFGVYYFLTMAKNSSEKTINTKDVKVELGSTLSNNIEDYATITGYNKNECSLNLDNVNIEKVSTYKYTVTCGKNNMEGLVIVDDTTKPEVITTDVTVALNTTLNPEDFIEECKDASKCSYKFQTNVEGLTKNIGAYDIEILVSDEYNNQNTVKAKLTVSRTAPAKYMTCKSEAEALSELDATFIEVYRIGIDANDNFYNSVRTTEYTFKDLNAYNKSVNDYRSTSSINNRSGEATFDENKRSISLKENKTIEDMNKDLKGKIPNNATIIKAFLSGLGYTCN